MRLVVLQRESDAEPPTADALLARIKEQDRPGCGSTSARRQASARPTRCCRRRTPCARVVSTSSSGYVETYGRRDTEAQIKDLEIVPRRKIEYRGVTHGGDGRRRHRSPETASVRRR